jgi:hypothetical protein
VSASERATAPELDDLELARGAWLVIQEAARTLRPLVRLLYPVPVSGWGHHPGAERDDAERSSRSVLTILASEAREAHFRIEQFYQSHPVGHLGVVDAALCDAMAVTLATGAVALALRDRPTPFDRWHAASDPPYELRETLDQLVGKLEAQVGVGPETDRRIPERWASTVTPSASHAGASASAAAEESENDLQELVNSFAIRLGNLATVADHLAFAAQRHEGMSLREADLASRLRLLDGLLLSLGEDWTRFEEGIWQQWDRAVPKGGEA